MAQIGYQSDFVFNNKKLSDFNGIRYNPDSNGIKYWTMPSPKHNTTTLPCVNGVKYFNTTYDSRIISIPVFIYDSIDIDEFNAWIAVDAPKEFYFIDDYKEIDVILNKGLDITTWYYDDFKGMTELEFICFDPLWRVRNEGTRKEILTLNVEKTFTTKTTLKAKPILAITPSGTQTIKIKFNDLTFTLTNISETVYVNSYDGEVYTLNNGVRINAFNKYTSNSYWDLPIIYPKKPNKITLLSGSVSLVEITPNSRML